MTVTQTNYKRIIVKIGSNVLTRPDGTLNITRMSGLVDQVAELHNRGLEVVMVSSGAMAAGRGLMRGTIKGNLDPVSARQLYSSVGQAKLINRYFDFFCDHGITCGQILTTKESLATRGHYLNQKHCMEVMLDHGVIPIVNENDTISVTELMFTDNDELSGLLASMMGAQALVILSNIDGVYDGDPTAPDTQVIRDIDSAAHLDDSSIIQDSKSSFGRGGMRTKFRIALKVAGEGIDVIIANGQRDGILTDVIDQRRAVPYTVFHRSSKPTSTVKKWIAHSEGFAKGTIHVNQGAFEALTSSKATSLLPVGIDCVTGTFEPNDIVGIAAPDGTTFAYGRTAYSSAKVAASAGHRGGRPVVHYDYMWVERNQPPRRD